MFTFLFATILSAITAAQCAPLSSSPPTLAPLYRRSDTDNTRYIVSIHQNTVEPSNRLIWLNSLLPSGASAKVSAKSVDEDDAAVVHHWEPSVFNGLAGKFDDASLAVLRAQSEVAYIQEDIVLRKSQSPSTKQTNAPWGLSRLSSSSPLSIGANFNPRNTSFPYTFPSSSGRGVDLYILDSGVHTTHSDFGDRATFLETFGDGLQGDDKDGHGTHVAGTAGGGFFGVAKEANLFAVKVLGDEGSGPTSDIISGLNLVARRVVQQAQEARAGNTTTTPTPNTNTTNPAQNVGIPSPTNQLSKRVVVNVNNFTLLNQLPNTLNNTIKAPIDLVTPSGARPSVVNLSLGGPDNNRALDAAVRSLVAEGIVMVVAAGNDGVDVGVSSPAGVEEAITVGAMDFRDGVPNFSNFGAKVDIFAPGASILSCGITSDTASAILSGTSMAAPHIAGLSALLLGEDPSLTPTEVKAKIQALAIRGALDGLPGGTRNLVASIGL